MDADGRLDVTFRALADATRRRMYAGLGRQPGLTTTELVAMTPGLSRWGVMKHLAVLRDAGLVQTFPEGRRRRHYRDPNALRALSDWLGANYD
jgi:DNA-binding transcriptional ArsR family regulator